VSFDLKTHPLPPAIAGQALQGGEPILQRSSVFRASCVVRLAPFVVRRGSLSILPYKDMTIFIVTQIFLRKNDYFFSQYSASLILPDDPEINS
jgi:hypothetical protein